MEDFDMKKMTILLIVMMAILFAFSSCDALLSAVNGGAAWNFNFAGTEWSLTEVDETYRKYNYTYDDTNNIVSTIEQTIPVTEIVKTLQIQKPAIGEDKGQWIYTETRQFVSAFAGPFTEVFANGNNTEHYSNFPSIIDNDAIALDVAIDIIYSGFAGGILSQITFIGNWQSFENGASELSYLFELEAGTTIVYSYATFDTTTVLGTTSISALVEDERQVENITSITDEEQSYINPGSNYSVSGSGDTALIVKMLIPNATGTPIDLALFKAADLSQ